jgi:hypothetical protein
MDLPSKTEVLLGDSVAVFSVKSVYQVYQKRKDTARKLGDLIKL